MNKSRKPYRDDIRFTEKCQTVDRAAAQELVDKFNAAHPIGTKVRYKSHPTAKASEHETISQAHCLEEYNYRPVIWLKGVLGCVAMAAVEVVEQEPEKCGHSHVKRDGFSSSHCEDCGEEL